MARIPTTEAGQTAKIPVAGMGGVNLGAIGQVAMSSKGRVNLPKHGPRTMERAGGVLQNAHAQTAHLRGQAQQAQMEGRAASQIANSIGGQLMDFATKRSAARNNADLALGNVQMDTALQKYVDEQMPSLDTKDWVSTFKGEVVPALEQAISGNEEYSRPVREKLLNNLKPWAARQELLLAGRASDRDLSYSQAVNEEAIRYYENQGDSYTAGALANQAVQDGTRPKDWLPGRIANIERRGQLHELNQAMQANPRQVQEMLGERVGSSKAGSYSGDALKNAQGMVGRDFKKGQTKRCADFMCDIFGEEKPAGVGSSAKSWNTDTVGALVNPSQRKPGDVVIFEKTYNGPNRETHVGIVSKDGNSFIHRPTAAKPVQESPLTPGTFHGDRILAVRRPSGTSKGGFKHWNSISTAERTRFQQQAANLAAEYRADEMKEIAGAVDEGMDMTDFEELLERSEHLTEDEKAEWSHAWINADPEVQYQEYVKTREEILEVAKLGSSATQRKIDETIAKVYSNKIPSYARSSLMKRLTGEVEEGEHPQTRHALNLLDQELGSIDDVEGVKALDAAETEMKQAMAENPDWGAKEVEAYAPKVALWAEQGRLEELRKPGMMVESEEVAAATTKLGKFYELFPELAKGSRDYHEIATAMAEAQSDPSLKELANHPDQHKARAALNAMTRKNANE